MIDIFRRRIPGVDEAREVASLKRQFSEAEQAYQAAQDTIRDVRKNETALADIPPGSPLERRRQPTGLSRRDRQALAEARKKRDTARERMELLKPAISDARAAAMRGICDGVRPDYVKALRRFWSARLARLSDELVSIGAVDQIRLELDAKQVRMTGLPPFTHSQKKAIEESSDLRAEVKELLAEGSLERGDVPAAVLKAWRLT